MSSLEGRPAFDSAAMASNSEGTRAAAATKTTSPWGRESDSSGAWNSNRSKGGHRRTIEDLHRSRDEGDDGAEETASSSAHDLGILFARPMGPRLQSIFDPMRCGPCTHL